MEIIHGFKVLTHDLRSPMRGGDPVFAGTLPHTLPPVVLSRRDSECKEGDTGWYACAELATALRIAGLWPNGRPSRAFHVETDDAVCVARGDKLRASSWTLTTECSTEEIAAAVRVMSEPFGSFADEMTSSQLAWRKALARPLRDPEAVERGLAGALHCRGLEWRLRRYDNVRATRAAWVARAAGDDWDAWVTRAAWVARAAGDDWDARAAWDARVARDARDAWDARVARDARAAWDALTVEFSARSKWTQHDPAILTHGLREAYQNGLEIVMPTGPNELGWAMTE